MAPRAIPTRTRFTTLLCLLAVLFLILPLPVCAASATHAAMQMPQCSPCCPAQLSATPACCAAQPQPATQAAPLAQVSIPRIGSSAFSLAVAPPHSNSRPIPATARTIPPPLLKTILRI